MFIEAYEATWEPEYLSCAHQLADILYGAQADLGTTRYDDVYMNEGKVKYFQLTGDPRMRDLFLNDMHVLSLRRDADVFADTRHTTLWGLSHAYWFTGDRSLLPYAAWQYDVATSRIPTEGEPHEIGAVGWTFEHAYESTLGNQLPTFAALMRDVPQLPLPAGPTGSGNGPIYLHEPEDREFTVTLEMHLYRATPGLGAAPFSNWEAWAARLPEEDRPALRVIAPDGSEISRVDLLTGTSSEPVLAADTGATRAILRLSLPADGQTGTYVLAPANSLVPLDMKIMDSTLPQHALGTDGAWVYGTTQYFRVPAGTREFAVELTAIMLRREIEVTVCNGQGDEVATAAWAVGSDCRYDPERFEPNAGAPAQDEAWSISFLSPMATFLRFEGIEPFVAPTPETLFVPDQAVEPHMIPEPEGDAPSRVQSPLADGEEALALPPEVGLALASPDGTPLLNEVEGTVEMWLRDTRRPTDLHNRTILRCGGLHLYRRIGVGTYLYLGAPGHQTGLVLPPGRWAHLAATWKPSTKQPGQTEVALFIDGVRVETSYNRHLAPEAGWAGAELLIPAQTAGLYLDELRVSDVARYDASFEPPREPFTSDANTLVLSRFDDDTALVRGAEVTWERR
jgi:hypothetical protein